MSLLPNARLASLRAARLSSAGGNLVNNSKPTCLSPQHRVLVQSVASISGKAKYEEWPKPEPWDYMHKGYKGRHSWYEGTLKRFDENTKLIIIDGLPAIGKQELAKALAEEFNMRCFPAVTMDYKYVTGYGFDLRTLDPKLPAAVRSYDEKSFLKDPKDKRCLSMQLEMMSLSYSQYMDALTHIFNTGQGVIMTRNPFTHQAFVEGCCKAGYITRDELRKGFSKLRDNSLGDLLKPHLILYLDVPVAKVHEKMRIREKGEEKAMPVEFLEAMEDWFKTRFLKEIEVNTEVLVYDWTEPGDVEVVVEDIERIDFNRFEVEPRHPKFKDWRYEEDIVASEMRWKYTNNKLMLMQNLRLPVTDLPRIWCEQDDIKALNTLYYNAPGYKFYYGWNPDQGDNVWWRSKSLYPSVEQNTHNANYVP